VKLTSTAKTLQEFPITKRWPAKSPEVLQLYSMPTPNGQKVSIMLEELGLAYEAHKIPLSEDGVGSDEFLSLNPNHKIPAIVDPNGPEGNAIGIFESGAILNYLADKTGQFNGNSPTNKYEVQQWLMFQMAGFGPMSGQFGFFFAFAGKDFEDKRPLERYIKEVKRQLTVIDRRLEGREWIAGEYSIADMSIAPWFNSIENFLKAGEVIGLRDLKNISDYMDRFNARPAVQRGNNVPPHDWN
jgi:GST-like protein